jgi:hypothetical protein
MSITPFTIGVSASVLLVAGAAWPVHTVSHPARSAKNWLFLLGGLGMFAYSFLGYKEGGPFFFVLLQIFITFASVLMLLNTSDKFDVPALSLCGIAMILWSLSLFEGLNTVFFIFGLSAIGIGYALETGTLKRNIALTVGSILIAVFSYVEASWIFFWLNAFFALFSGVHSVKLLRVSKKVSTGNK